MADTVGPVRLSGSKPLLQLCEPDEVQRNLFVERMLVVIITGRNQRALD